MERASSSFQPQGGGALLSVLIVAALLLTATILAATHAALLEIELQDTREYQASLAAAWSCEDMARTRLQIDATRFTSGTTTVTLTGSTTCAILLGDVSGNTSQLKTSGYSGNSFTNLEVTASRASSSAPFRITTWREY